ncbi:hypothetical protein ON010_g14288 [Phytophthora cinnamomi]|nr:hypothetical protein ON010_g14288 [Phytophthora cinnamomi]
MARNTPEREDHAPYMSVLAPALYGAVRRNGAREIFATADLNELPAWGIGDAASRGACNTTGVFPQSFKCPNAFLPLQAHDRTPALNGLVLHDAARVEVAAADLLEQPLGPRHGRADAPALDRLIDADPARVQAAGAHLYEVAGWRGTITSGTTDSVAAAAVASAAEAGAAGHPQREARSVRRSSIQEPSARATVTCAYKLQVKTSPSDRAMYEFVGYRDQFITEFAP